MLKKCLVAAVATAMLAVAYVSWPVFEAYRLRQAVRAGDTVALGSKVDWPSVRASLKQSVADLVSRERAAPAGGSGSTDRSWWASMKLAMAPAMADRLIDTYVSADGIGRIDAARLGLKSARSSLSKLGEGDLDAAWTAATARDEPGRIARFLAFYDRIVKARFHALDRVEFEIRDRNAPARRYIGEFHLRDLEWKLVSVRIAGSIF